jgi:hypothetical protein
MLQPNIRRLKFVNIFKTYGTYTVQKGCSVPDPDLSVRMGSLVYIYGSGSFPFHISVEQTEIMVAK